MILLGSNHYLSAGSTNTHSIDLEASSSQYLSITDASQTGLDITGDMTIEFWLNQESDVSGFPIAKWNTAGNQRSWLAYYNASSSVMQFATSSTGANALNTGTTFSYNPSLSTWYHHSFVYDASAGTCDWYLNGVFQSQATGLHTSLFNSTANFMIGRSQSSAVYIDGLIDDVRVWNDVRTATEIANNYNKQLVGNEANLQGYWQLNNSPNDLTSNANHLTETNSPVYSTDTPF